MLNYLSLKKYIILLALSISALFIASDKVSALNYADFKPGRIIDDVVFTNKSSMNVDQIQNFLNSKVPVCDTNHAGFNQTLKRYTDAQGREVVNTARFDPPFTCLKNYQEHPTQTYTVNYSYINTSGATISTSITKKINNSHRLQSVTFEYFSGNPANGISRTLATYVGVGGGSIAGARTAAQIIFDAAQTYNINPQALIVTLEKETSLITDDWAAGWQYDRAMGWACPDTGIGQSANCDTSKEGFMNQVMGAAWQYRNDFNGIDTPNFWSPYGKGINTILYNPSVSCGSRSVNIENQATAVLYKYTPYTPNDAAILATPGVTVNCGAYGNRNFWRLFNWWFGSTIGPEYAWSIESLTYGGGDNSIAIGETETITLKARNIGRQPWYNHGNHPIRLGTWEPADRKSALFESTRLATLIENMVNINEVGTFTFNITPKNTGVFLEGMNLVAENHMWLPWTGLRPTINITQPYSATIQNIIYENGTGLMDPGSKQLITVIVKNTGSTTWNKLGPNPVRIGTWTPNRQSEVSATWVNKIRAAESNETNVAPGQNAGYQFYVTMPRSGNFYEKFNLVAENVAWLSSVSDFTLYLQGKKVSWQPLWHSHSTGTANITKNTNFSLTLKVRNTGETTWLKNSSFPIRLATASPQDRGSWLYDSSWIRDVRPATILEDSVAPGQVATFIFNAKSPPSPGAYYERFSLVQEGIQWLNDPGFVIYVNSTL